MANPALGVVQGSVLGTLPFSIFINGIVAQIDFCRFHIYADDVQLYLSDDLCSLDEFIRRMNADFDRLYIWAAENGLCLNPEKPQAIVIGFPNFVLFSPFQKGSATIPFCTRVKSLNIVCHRVYFTLLP
jgi:hypothetical protein